MNAKIALSAAVLAAFAGSAMAESPLLPNDSFTATKTRAEVQADLAAYKKAGVNPWAMSYNPLRYFQGQKSRAEVTAEYIASRDQVRQFTGEDSGSTYLAQVRGTAIPSSTLAGTPVNAQ